MMMLLAMISRIEQHDGIEQGQETDEANKKDNTTAFQPLRLRIACRALKRVADQFNQTRGAIDADNARYKIDKGHEQRHGADPMPFSLSVVKAVSS